MKSTRQVPAQQTYLPAELYHEATLKHSFRKVALATPEAPQHVCGVALRVGYTGSKETDLALYRLRVKQSPDRVAVTLPGFFVLENGIFCLYQGSQGVTSTSGEMNRHTL